MMRPPDAPARPASGVHDALLSGLREKIAEAGGGLAEKFDAMDDARLLRLMFASVRGSEAPVGLKLTKLGFEVMRRFFEHFPVARPKDDTLNAGHLLWLDRTATMPYLCNGDGYVFFEHRLAIKLKLADGRIGTLIEIEAP